MALNQNAQATTWFNNHQRHEPNGHASKEGRQLLEYLKSVP